MNKILRLLLACVISQGAIAAGACWYATYSPAEYYTCHIPTIESVGAESMVELWNRTLLSDVSTDEIEKLIYSDNGYTVEQIRNLEVSPALKKRLTANNNSLLEYVCTMRSVNDLRAQISNPWYYYYAGEPKSARLNQLANTCLRRLTSRYGDRYAVLAARALNTLKRYPEIDSLAHNHKFSDKTMEAIFRPEYAGSLFNMGKYEEAAETYAKAGDIASLTQCINKLGVYQGPLSAVARMADYESNYNLVVNNLSSYIHDLENDRYSYSEFSEYATERRNEIRNLIETAHTCSATAGIYQPLWRYAEAMGYLIDSNNFAKADSVLALINLRLVDPEFAKSIRTLHFITSSRTKPYDDNYLTWVSSEAKWLIQQSDAEREKKKKNYHHNDSNYLEYDYYSENDYSEFDISFSRDNHYSKLYFSDMLHKAADVIIVPRMLEHGDSVAALQLLDIVDYANLSDEEVPIVDTHGNASACLAIELGADVLVKAIKRAKNPRTSLDRLWVKIGSIRNADRWFDFAGTALLAEGRYKEAISYLQKVSTQYAKERNLYESDPIRNPFAVKLRANPKCQETDVLMTVPRYHKLWFAQQMAKLEDTLNNESIDSETRAEAKLKYGVGMANSAYPCWELTQYGEGETVFSPWINKSDNIAHKSSHDIIHDYICESYEYGPNQSVCFAHLHHRLGRLRSAGQSHITQALEEIKDPETKAAYLRSMAHYRTIKHHYANTTVGKEMRSKCDKWDMY